MSSKGLAAAGLAGLLNLSYAVAQTAPPLGNAASFAVLGKNVDNRGATTVTGNLGGSITNPPTFIAGGVRNDLAPAARSDAAAAYDALSADDCAQLSGEVVAPNTYCVSSLPAFLTLEGDGVWIFRATTLTAAPGTTVRMAGGAREANVFWQVAGDATLGPSTTFAGNLIARGNIAFGNGTTLSGRAISLGGTISLDGNKLSLCCEPLGLAPVTLPAGTADKPYSATVAASGGLPSYTYQFSESIPGLTPSGATLAGTPTTAGTYTVRVTATDAAGCTASRDYTIEIACSTIVLSPPGPELPRATVGVFYSQMFATDCATSAVTCTATPPRPAGLSLDECVLSGIPSLPGTYEFTITARDGTHIEARRTYQLVVVCGAVPLPESLPNGCVGAPYSATVAGTTVSFSGNIPPGLSPLGKTLSGTSMAPGCYDVIVTVTDSFGCSASKTYRICFTAVDVLPTSLPPATVGVYYEQIITPTAGTIVSYSGKEPYGLEFNLETRKVTGTPAPGPATSFTVIAVDANGCSGSRTYTIALITPPIQTTPVPNDPCAPGSPPQPATCPPGTTITLTPPTLPNAPVGVPYAQLITAAGGTAPYTFAPIGTLPPGLTLTGGGLLSGTPTACGRYVFTITATDANGCIATIGCISVTCVNVPAMSPWTLALLALVFCASGLAILGRRV
jgi:large repetitive protein